MPAVIGLPDVGSGFIGMAAFTVDPDGLAAPASPGRLTMAIPEDPAIAVAAARKIAALRRFIEQLRFRISNDWADGVCGHGGRMHAIGSRRQVSPHVLSRMSRGGKSTENPR